MHFIQQRNNCFAQPTSLLPYILASSVSLAICASSGLTLTRGTFSRVVGGPILPIVLLGLELAKLNGINRGSGFLGLAGAFGAWHSAKWRCIAESQDVINWQPFSSHFNAMHSAPARALLLSSIEINEWSDTNESVELADVVVLPVLFNAARKSLAPT